MSSEGSEDATLSRSWFAGAGFLLWVPSRLSSAEREVKQNLSFGHTSNFNLCVGFVSCFCRNCSESWWVRGMEENTGEYALEYLTAGHGTVFPFLVKYHKELYYFKLRAFNPPVEGD